MTIYLKAGGNISIRNDDSLSVSKKLPLNTYIIQKHPITEELYLETTNTMKYEGKVYGSAESRVDRIMNTFNDRETSMGVLLSGEKGSGKSTLMRLVVMEGLKQGIPSIIINAGINAGELTQFFAKIQDNVIVILDEFEKVFNPREGQQEGFLPLLDGMFSSKKLFILGANDRWSINDFMINRPGRIYYHFKYRGLEEDFIREYSEDTLLHKHHHLIDDIVSVSSAVKSFNFDMMKALVEEINRYGESPKEAIEYLNIEPSSKGDKYKIVKFVIDGKEILEKDRNTHLFDGHGGSIFNPQQNIWLNYKENDKQSDEYDWSSYSFRSSDLLKIEDGKYIFKTDRAVVEVVFDNEREFDFSSLL